MVLDQDTPDLFNLIRLGLVPFRLQIDDVVDTISREDMVTAFDPLGKSKTDQQMAKCRELNVGVGAACQNLIPKFRIYSHYPIVSERESTCMYA